MGIHRALIKEGPFGDGMGSRHGSRAEAEHGVMGSARVEAWRLQPVRAHLKYRGFCVIRPQMKEKRQQTRG